MTKLSARDERAVRRYAAVWAMPVDSVRERARELIAAGQPVVEVTLFGSMV